MIQLVANKLSDTSISLTHHYCSFVWFIISLWCNLISIGAPLIIHPGRDTAAPFEIVDVLRNAGADLSRTVMSHLDRTLFDHGDFLRFAETGCISELDLFGSECSHYHQVARLPSILHALVHESVVYANVAKLNEISGIFSLVIYWHYYLSEATVVNCRHYFYVFLYCLLLVLYCVAGLCLFII